MSRRLKPVGILSMLTVCAALAYGAAAVHADGNEEFLYRFEKGETVETIFLENQNGTLRFFKNDAGEWLVGDGKEYRADEKKMKLFTDALEGFPVTRILKEEREEYGFSEDTSRVAFTTSSGKEHSFLTGGSTMTKNHTYIKDLDTGRVVITNSSTVILLDGGLTSFRSREIFSVRVDNLVEIALKRPGQELLSMRLTDGEWEMLSPYRAPARRIELLEFLSGMKDWNVYGFASRPALEARETDPFANAAALTLKDGAGNEQTLEIGEPDGMVVPVRNGGAEDILLLYTEEADLSVLEADRLLFFAPLKAGIDEISEIILEGGGVRIVFQTDGERGLFTCNGNPVDPEAFYSFYVSYIGMTAAGGADGEPAAGAETLMTLTTVFRDGRRTELRLVEQDGGTCHMIVNNSLSGFYLGNEKLVALMEKLARMGGY